MSNLFKVEKVSTLSKARLGEIKTAHGTIKTPAFVPVGTKGTIKALPPQFINDIGIQAAFVNTYHLVTHPGGGVIEAAGGIHKFANLDIPLMSDSGGFQVFSLARSKLKDSVTQFFHTRVSLSPLAGPPSKVKRIAFTSSLEKQKKASPLSLSEKIKHFQADVRGEEEPLLVKISDDGVKFRSTYDGKLIEFTPEKSIRYQQQIGADLMMAFDECVPYQSSHDYTSKSMQRTHSWLKRCITEVREGKVGMETGQEDRNKKLDKNLSSTDKLPNTLPNQPSNFQFLYGVIQGGIYEDLRKKSAEFVAGQPVDGVAIGGVSVGETKKEMRDQVRWAADYLPKDKPVHLLGVGQFDDIIDLVKYGIDTFDCVEPTRKARMGAVFQYQISNIKYQNDTSKIKNSIQEINIDKGKYKNNLEPVDENCECYTCQNFTKAYLHHLFKQKEILGYTLATYHNLWVMENFFTTLREMISKDLI